MYFRGGIDIRSKVVKIIWQKVINLSRNITFDESKE